MEYLGKVSAYEKYTGERHVFEIYRKTIGAPFVVMLDGSFLATCETGSECGDEVRDTIQWFGWVEWNPNFA